MLVKEDKVFKPCVFQNIDSINHYTFGIEIEFFMDEAKSRIYDKKLNDSGVSTGTSILGWDGSGSNTKEFRSPIFISNNPEKGLIHLVKYADSMQNYLKKEYGAKFVPWYNSRPGGIHFSLGGKFLSLTTKEKNTYVDRAKELARLMPRLLADDNSLDLYNSRSFRYPPEIPGNGLRQNTNRTEFRIFPSVEVIQLYECLMYLVIGKNLPTAKIKFN